MKVRVVDDERDIATLMRLGFELQKIEVVVTTDRFGDLLGPDPWNGITHAIVDWKLPGEVHGSDILIYLSEAHPHIHRTLFSADGNLDADPLLYHRYFAKPTSTMEIIEALRKESTQ